MDPPKGSKKPRIFGKTLPVTRAGLGGGSSPLLLLLLLLLLRLARAAPALFQSPQFLHIVAPICSQSVLCNHMDGAGCLHRPPYPPPLPPPETHGCACGARQQQRNGKAPLAPTLCIKVLRSWPVRRPPASLRSCPVVASILEEVAGKGLLWCCSRS